MIIYSIKQVTRVVGMVVEEEEEGCCSGRGEDGGPHPDQPSPT